MNPTFVSSVQQGNSKQHIIPPCQVPMTPNNQGYSMPPMQQMPNQMQPWANPQMQSMQQPIQQYSQAVALPNHGGMSLNSPNNVVQQQPQLQQQPLLLLYICTMDKLIEL